MLLEDVTRRRGYAAGRERHAVRLASSSASAACCIPASSSARTASASRRTDGWVKVPQLGGVRIGDDVEVGANTTIDRGAIEDTVIEDGVKLDNQIQIGHNVRIGAHTVIAGCVGISGSTMIGTRCMIGGQVGIAGHLTICDDVVVTGRSFVNNSIRKPGYYSGGIRSTSRRDSARMPRASTGWTSCAPVRRLQGRAGRRRDEPTNRKHE